MPALADAERHGCGIIKEVSFRTDGRVETGTLFAALKRMRDDKLIEVVPPSERPPQEDRRRRTHRLTTFGRESLRAETERLTELVGTAIAKQVQRASLRKTTRLTPNLDARFVHGEAQQLNLQFARR